MKSTQNKPNRLQALTSALLSRLKWAGMLGQQYGGDRKIYQALGYPTNITPEMYAAKFGRQDIANAIINRPVNATWRGGMSLLESDDENETALEKSFTELSKRLKLRSVFPRLDRLTGIGRYGILLLGLDDVKAPQDFAKPVDSGKRNLLYVKPLGEDSAVINLWEKETSSERFGLPVIYDVKIMNPGSDASSQIRVHYSRIIHVAGDLLESEVFGVPRLQAVYNRLMDLEKLVGGSAEMFWRGARQGYLVKLAENATLTQEVRNGLQDQFDEFEHNLRRYFGGEGIDDFKSLEQQVADPKGHVDIQIQMISAVTGIPKRILTGSERGELASTEDKNTWLDLIQDRREEFAEPVIINPFVDRCIEYSILPSAKDDYSIQWRDLWAPSEKEKAEVGKTRAEALAAYGRDPMSQEVVPPDAFYQFFLGFTEEQITLIREMKEAAVTGEGDDFGEEDD